LRQLTAFPVHIVQLDPANLGTVDADHVGLGENGLEYCIKTCAKTPLAPAAEYICHALASACALATVDFDIVQLPDGSLAFGSIWDSSKHKTPLLILTGQSPGHLVQENLSQIYAFDLFVHNVDRHFNNYLCAGGRTVPYTVKVFDFSRAFTATSWPLPSLPMLRTANTVMTYERIRHFLPFMLTEAQKLLDRISTLRYDTFKSIIDGVPASWLDASKKRDVLKWWAGPRTSRINQIRKGLENGTFL
jgi:hypothetical protein